MTHERFARTCIPRFVLVYGEMYAGVRITFTVLGLFYTFKRLHCMVLPISVLSHAVHVQNLFKPTKVSTYALQSKVVSKLRLIGKGIEKGISYHAYSVKEYPKKPRKLCSWKTLDTGHAQLLVEPRFGLVETSMLKKASWIACKTCAVRALLGSRSIDTDIF